MNAKNQWTDNILFGGSFYPENMPTSDWEKSLQYFKDAGFNTLRIGESAWGNIEIAEGKFYIDWLLEFITLCKKFNLRVMLGTCSYIPPLWLHSKYPDMCQKPSTFSNAHTLGRHSPCIFHPGYKEAVHKFITSYYKLVKNQSNIIAWQLDNEIDFLLNWTDFHPLCEDAFQKWIEFKFASIGELNKGWNLNNWGVQIDSFKSIKIPNASRDGNLPYLKVAFRYFMRDSIFEFLSWQTALLREAGYSGEVFTDFLSQKNPMCDDPRLESIFKSNSFNFYPFVKDDIANFTEYSYKFNLNRCALSNHVFFISETRVNVAGDTAMWDPHPLPGQVRMWAWFSLLHGAHGLLYWSLNRFHGGHWPFWGSFLNFTNDPELEFNEIIQLGKEIDYLKDDLSSIPLDCKAAFYSDFENRTIFNEYSYFKNSPQLYYTPFQAIRVLNFGIDFIKSESIHKGLGLSKYKVIIFAGTPCAKGDDIYDELLSYVKNGGILIVFPLCGYQDQYGMMEKGGLSHSWENLTGVSIHSFRWIGENRSKVNILMKNIEKRFSVGGDGFIEFPKIINQEVEILAELEGDVLPKSNAIWPAITKRTIDKGAIYRFFALPEFDNLATLLLDYVGIGNKNIIGTLPLGLHQCQREDGSFIVVNTTQEEITFSVDGAFTDAIKNLKFKNFVKLSGYDVVWLRKVAQDNLKK